MGTDIEELAAGLSYDHPLKFLATGANSPHHDMRDEEEGDPDLVSR
jgi:hypothetical protein